MGAIVFILFCLLIAACLAVYFLYPKGHDRNLHVSSIILTLTCVYLMWAITYMAQLNPIIPPKKALPKEGAGGH
ncbi:putative vacuolar ATP synthase subunit E [Catenaria anguillulae PL171]|uniref:Putative vacuolar ATP synthase subunit E n=1 Tax=Catenaria anguillulae PL171 TaxID=765915 RepID=A0A1Y2HP93_9FUNG|nr:putative vacuolar ATP synthase subunit E [Catenaria anguillulae PL171]